MSVMLSQTVYCNLTFEFFSSVRVLYNSPNGIKGVLFYINGIFQENILSGDLLYSVLLLLFII